MEAGKRIRVATYTRISTDEEHQPYSLEAQTERLGAYIKSQDGWELSRRFTDQMTGSKLERPGLQKALSEGRVRRFDLLLVYRVDRLSRSVRGLAQILEELDKAGVLFRSATEPFDTGTPAGRMMVQMLGVFAEFERATLIDRVIAGMERKAARGGWHGGVVPFGYRLNSGHFLEVKAEEAPLVRLIFELYSQQLLGARAVAMSLNERGHRNAAGRLWSHRSVLGILQNRTYLGEIFFRGVHHPAPHPALIDLRLFESAKSLLEERGEDFAKRRSNPFDYLLTGLMRCTRCGKTYVGAAAHGKRNRYRYYVCHSRHRYGGDACSADRLPADRLETAVTEALVQTLARTDLVEKAVSEANVRAQAARPRHQDELTALDAEIGKTLEALERYFAAFESGSMSEASCAARVERLSQKLGQLRTRQAELKEVVESEPRSHVTRQQMENVLSHVRAVLAEGHPPQVKAVLQALVAEVRVESRSSIRPVFRVPAGGVRILDRMVDLSSHNTNPPGVFDGAPYELRDSSDDRDEAALASIRAFLEEFGVRPTAEAWTATGMTPEREDDPQKVRKLSVSRGAGQRPAPVADPHGAEILDGDYREQTLATAKSQSARRGRQLAHLVDSSPGVRCHEHRIPGYYLSPTRRTPVPGLSGAVFARNLLVGPDWLRRNREATPQGEVTRDRLGRLGSLLLRLKVAKLAITARNFGRSWHPEQTSTFAHQKS